ncbi:MULTISPECIES: DUF6266 family protein [Pedobacter]|uniref:Uncharacterized protein n=1 Tax=Pedobacter heparinus (strain ATCC 13125 / DSM 2366 / CIP 104194 / JCM 7457 / NBRC 12017 / NCIMB 9290 / NRRL B-14731 / HIM 762-3) TaxID=485917 RepID=C6XYT2_PEDHD|nr:MULTISPECIES: DUF6266 family protein [Pedobacter]ACU04564.1 hypothetical protein Phep_2360 [Pedobacter heparinus DSM 2366]MBB5437587.1 hypothetical protein [Pedobacter sp. AK017]
MGIQRSGILGPFRNKVGPAVGRHHMGQDLLLPLPHTSNKPPTPAQTEARLKFGLLNSFLKRIKLLVNVGFKAYVKHNSPVNEAYSYNADRAFVKDGDSFLINYPKMVYSRGHVVGPEGAQVSSADGKITFSWQAQKQSAYCQYTDLGSFLVYHPVKDMAVILQGKVNRYAQSFVIQLPVDFPGDKVHCYMSFASANGKLQGDSLYVGELVVVA